MKMHMELDGVTKSPTAYPDKSNEIAEREGRHEKTWSELKEDRLRFRRRRSTDHADNVRMIENAITWLLLIGCGVEIHDYMLQWDLRGATLPRAMVHATADRQRTDGEASTPWWPTM
jgi:hypothetical protein